MQLKLGLRGATYRPLLERELGRRLLLEQAPRARKIKGTAYGRASQVTNAAFRALLLSSLCYFSLLQICLDVRTLAWAAAQRGGPGVGGGGGSLGAPGLGVWRRLPASLRLWGPLASLSNEGGFRTKLPASAVSILFGKACVVC